MRVIWWLAGVLGVSLFSIILSEQGATAPVQNLTFTVSAPIEGGLRDLASPVNDFVKGITDRGDLVRENERLKAENEALKAQLAEQQDAQQRAEDLEEALRLRESRPDDELKAANVIAEDPSGLKDFVAIDAGTSDGLDEGMIVLSKYGSLLGTVALAYEGYAWVRLITDPDSSVNAQVNPTITTPGSDGRGVGASSEVLPQGTPAPAEATTAPSAQTQPGPPTESAEPVRAIAEGDLADGLTLDLIPSSAPLRAGDLVVTSGLGGNFPPALLIGSVREIRERPQAPFKSAILEPAADLSSLDMVWVVLSFKPERLTPP